MPRKKIAASGRIWMDPHTPSKPEILAIASILEIEIDTALGAITRVWSWFVTHTADGIAAGVTPAVLDQAISRDGIADAMIAVGWLQYAGGSLIYPEFNRHCEPREGARHAAERRADRIHAIGSTRLKHNEPARRAGASGSESERVPESGCQSGAIGTQTVPQTVPKRTPNQPRTVPIGELIGTVSSPGTPTGTGSTGPENIFSPVPVPVVSRNGTTERPRVLEHVQRGDLLRVRNLKGLLCTLCDQNPIDGIGPDEQSLELIVAAAVRALQEARKPVSMFVWTVANREWNRLTASHRRRAAELIAEFKSDPVNGGILDP